MDDNDGRVDRRGLIRALGAGAVGALLGVGVTGGAVAAAASAPAPFGAKGGAPQPVVLYGSDGKPLPRFREDDPGTVRTAGRTAAAGYAQDTLSTATAKTIRRAPRMAGIWLQVEAGAVRVRTDGADATATAGEVIGAGFAERYDVPSLSVIGNGAPAVIQTWSE